MRQFDWLGTAEDDVTYGSAVALCDKTPVRQALGSRRSASSGIARRAERSRGNLLAFAPRARRPRGRSNQPRRYWWLSAHAATALRSRAAGATGWRESVKSTVELKYAAAEACHCVGPAMVSRAYQQVALNARGISIEPTASADEPPRGDAAMPLRHPAASLGHRKCHKYVDVARNGVMQTMPYASAAVTREDDDVDCPPSLERLSLHLKESLLNGNLTDDAIAIQRRPRPVPRRPCRRPKGLSMNCQFQCGVALYCAAAPYASVMNLAIAGRSERAACRTTMVIGTSSTGPSFASPRRRGSSACAPPRLRAEHKRAIVRSHWPAASNEVPSSGNRQARVRFQNCGLNRLGARRRGTQRCGGWIGRDAT